jgi:hypothetical protein
MFERKRYMFEKCWSIDALIECASQQLWVKCRKGSMCFVWRIPSFIYM